MEIGDVNSFINHCEPLIVVTSSIHYSLTMVNDGNS